MIFKKATMLVLCLIAGLQIYGCGAVILGGAAAGTTYVYTEGWVERNYSADVDQVFDACVKAAKNMDMVIEKRTLEVSSGEIKATKGEKSYWFKMEEESKDVTTLSIREGILGNKEASQKIHEAVKSQL